MNRLIFKTALNFKTPTFQYIRLGVNSRCYSNYYNVVPKPKTAFKPGEFELYQSYFPEVVEHLTTFDKVLPPEVAEYFGKILNFNVPGHEQASGPLVLSTYKSFVPPEKQTTEDIRLACIMGWVNDMIGNGVQISDDILDSSQTRVNKPCWYKNEDVGIKAIQHSAAVLDASLMVLCHFLSGHHNYIPILEWTTEIKFKTAMAQTLDLMSEGQPQFYTKEHNRVLSSYRGSYFSVMHPVCTGMYLAGVNDPELHAELKVILDEIGIFFAVQNDILDCYGQHEITGKHSSDIQKGKNTWLAAQAMTDANPSQKQIFLAHYGKLDLHSRNVILKLYKDLDILKKFLRYEQESYEQIHDMIDNMSKEIPKELIRRVTDAFYGKF